MSRHNNIAVIGAGAWGTALAQVFAREGRKVVLYAREPEVAESINKKFINEIFLPGIVLHSTLRATTHLDEAVDSAGVVLMVAPTQFKRAVLTEIKAHLPSGAAIVNCAKGIEISTGKLLSQVAAEIVPDAPYAVLSGPTFAHEVARGLPTAVTFATSAKHKDAERWAQALSAKTFRPYLSHDIVGAEIAGAVKNVIAIACGIVEGKGLGQNARAAVISRGMAEIKRLGLHMGAKADTFLGLSGLGDLTLTCNSMSSRNFSLGAALGQGRTMEEVLGERRSVAEGVTTAMAIARNAHTHGVEMPIAKAVNDILHHRADIDAVIGALLSRDLKEETA